MWRRRFAGDSAVVGRSVNLDGQSHTIIGVAPAGFQFPDDETEIWKPIAFDNAQLSENERGSRYLSVIARMKPGVTIGQAAELELGLGEPRDLIGQLSALCSSSLNQ